MQNKYITNPIEHQKMLLSYNNIKINSNAQKRACEALQNLEKVLQQMHDKKIILLGNIKTKIKIYNEYVQ